MWCALAVGLGAQSPGDPLTLIRVVRQDLSSRNPALPYRMAKAPVDVIGMRAVTGSTQTWLLEQHGSFASIDRVDEVLSKGLLNGEAEMSAPSVSLIGLYRHGLSYRPDEALKQMAGARYLQVSIYRNRPGYDVDFAELIRMRRAILDNFNVDRPELGYQVISGETSGTYLFISPLSSMKTLDETITRWLNHRDGGPVGVPGGKGRQVAAEGDMVREHLLFRVEPDWMWSREYASQ